MRRGTFKHKHCFRFWTGLIHFIVLFPIVPGHGNNLLFSVVEQVINARPVKLRLPDRPPVFYGSCESKSSVRGGDQQPYNNSASRVHVAITGVGCLLLPNRLSRIDIQAMQPSSAAADE